jgi:indolepyruvate ferredoxin oxidoreductase beta subunit
MKPQPRPLRLTCRAGGAVVQEMVRWLALWMAFDDIVRVAAAKLAASRMARVQREVGLRDGDLLKVYDHFKPGVPEFAALLPPGAGRSAAGLGPAPRGRRACEPWALPLKVGTHTRGWARWRCAHWPR